jgi:benzoylformate decarboxylase
MTSHWSMWMNWHREVEASGNRNHPMRGLTVYEASQDLLRSLGLTTIFGNVPSTEQSLLHNLPTDFQYVHRLGNGAVVAIADGFAQATEHPALVSLHTSSEAECGNPNYMTAYLNKTPLIILAPQQRRDRIHSKALLTNRDETLLPKPGVKWAYQISSAQNVPAAIMRAYTIAIQPPSGPVYLSIPLDDWDQTALGEPILRSASSRYAPDPDRLADFAVRISKSKCPALVYGQEIDRSGGWDTGVMFAEHLRASVYLPPNADRISFPQNHRQYQGVLPKAIGPLTGALRDHDLVLAIGAPVFRYSPYVAGEYLPRKCALLQITSDAYDAGAAPVGDSLLADAHLALDALLNIIPKNEHCALPAPLKRARELPLPPNDPLTLKEVYAALSEARPHNAITIEECRSNVCDLFEWWPIVEQKSYYSFPSGDLGWDSAATVGIALAQKKINSGRSVIAFIGWESIQKSVEMLCAAAREQLRIVFVATNKSEDTTLDEVAMPSEAVKAAALNLAGLDVGSTARGCGCAVAEARTKEGLIQAFTTALNSEGPTLIKALIKHELQPAIAHGSEA